MRKVRNCRSIRPPSQHNRNLEALCRCRRALQFCFWFWPAFAAGKLAVVLGDLWHDCSPPSKAFSRGTDRADHLGLGTNLSSHKRQWVYSHLVCKRRCESVFPHSHLLPDSVSRRENVSLAISFLPSQSEASLPPTSPIVLAF